jgi:amino acid permease
MECTLVVYCFGSCLAYLVVIGNSIVSVLHALNVNDGIFGIVTFHQAIKSPVSLY